MRWPGWRGPRRIAHRGAGLHAPENTIAALADGYARGYRAVEFDVMLTADDVPLLMHDADFGRTIAGRGAVATTSWAELATKDAGAWHSAPFAGERVPRLDAVLAWCRERRIWMNVEIKPSPGADAATGRAVAALVDGATDVLLSSFSVEALEAACERAPDVPRGLLVGRPPRDVATTARALGCATVNVAERHVDAALADDLHAAGFALLAYTIVDAERARILDACGVDATFVDRLDRVPYEGGDALG